MENNFSKYLDKLVVVLLFAIILASCSNDEIPSPVFSDDNISVVDIEGKRTLAEAILLSSQSRGRTRSIDFVEEVRYVVDNGDTVAYIINYANKGGFSIIAADNSVKPLLAFSDKGSFSVENELARNYFVGNIGKYVEQERLLSRKAKCDAVNRIAQVEDTIYYWHEPKIQIALGQREPFNKIVEQYYPGCPAGCGPVAAAMIMAYCKPRLVFKDYLFGFTGMNDALLRGPDSKASDSGLLRTYSDPPKFLRTWTNTYDGAVGAFSQLLYEMGKLMKASYKKNETSAGLENAAEAIASTGYIVSEIDSFDQIKMIEGIDDNEIYFQRGITLKADSTETLKGHFWVIDGYKYGLTESDEYVDCYFYCHWGWYGQCDGYFTGAILSPLSSTKYKLANNFSVKIENK